MLCPQHLVYSRCSFNTLVNVGKTMGQHALYGCTYVYTHSHIRLCTQTHTHSVFSQQSFDSTICSGSKTQSRTKGHPVLMQFHSQDRREIEQISQLITVSLDVAWQVFVNTGLSTEERARAPPGVWQRLPEGGHFEAGEHFQPQIKIINNNYDSYLPGTVLTDLCKWTH